VNFFRLAGVSQSSGHAAANSQLREVPLDST
jgi:hypothetical protein